MKAMPADSPWRNDNRRRQSRRAGQAVHAPRGDGWTASCRACWWQARSVYHRRMDDRSVHSGPVVHAAESRLRWRRNPRPPFSSM
jgi:hypothetical protein